jgi:hypothetical protein
MAKVPCPCQNRLKTGVKAWSVGGQDGDRCEIELLSPLTGLAMKWRFNQPCLSEWRQFVRKNPEYAVFSLTAIPDIA